ncbi:hypothetical protein WKY82_08000 [Gordonia malaquae]|uniref:hypothetical protein n=1 Tax=Gordonia TaxID=2053 RepID=UPI0030C7973C
MRPSTALGNPVGASRRNFDAGSPGVGTFPGSSSAVETRCVVTVERRVALGESVVGRVVALRWSQTKLTA